MNKLKLMIFLIFVREGWNYLASNKWTDRLVHKKKKKQDKPASSIFNIITDNFYKYDKLVL